MAELGFELRSLLFTYLFIYPIYALSANCGPDINYLVVKRNITEPKEMLVITDLAKSKQTSVQERQFVTSEL